MGLSITRTFDAPRDLVYKVWSEAEHLARWWGPKGFDLEVKTLDFRPGGMFNFGMSNEDGAEMWAKFVFVETRSPERIVYISSFSDPAGNTARAPFSQEFPLEIYSVVTLTEHAGKTTPNVALGPLNATAAELAFNAGMEGSMQHGYKGTFDELEAYFSRVAA